MVIDPDEEVAAAISDVFAAFTATGSAYGVARVFAGRRFPRRAYGGVWAGQVRWGRLTHARAAGILRNPAYAGAYVYGRRRSRQVVHPDGSVHCSVTELPRDQWEVLIPGHHAGDITFEEYLANEAKLAASRTNAGARPPREGTALCQGIVFCGACGRSMQVRYQDRYPRYECSHSRADHVAAPLCGSVRADTVDQAVTAALLAAVEPAQVALALAAAEEVTARRQRSVRAAELAVERARYDAERAERAFLACEPENRLVARSLEARWETRLADLAEAEAALATQRSARPELPSPDQLAATVADLPALWSAPATSDKDRKRLLRTLLGDVTLTPSAENPSRLTAGLRWKSGATQQLLVTRRKNAIQLRATDPAAIELARRIGPGCDNNALATALNDAGHRTGTGQPFDGVAAANLRNYHHIPYPGLLDDGELTPRQVAGRTGVSAGTIHYWINAGYLPARRGPAGRWAIPFPPETEAACRDRAAGSAHQHRDTDPAPRREQELSIADAARRLGVKPDVIYAWAEWGHVPARRGDAGRLWIDFTPAIERACVQPGAGTEAVQTAVLAELHGRDRWLLVFDNAENPADLRPWLPGGGGHVLITSRERNWAEIAAPVEIDVLARTESVAILQDRVAGIRDADADRLAAQLGDLPLAIAQAAGFMAETGTPAGQYLELLGTQAGQLLDQAAPGSDYPQSLAAATLLIVGRLDAEDLAAAQLASLCAFLAAEPIPEDLFTSAPADLPAELAARAADPLAWRQTLAHLARQSLVRIDQRGLQLNRLTRAFLRDRLTPAQAAATRERTEAILADSDPRDPGNPVTWPRWTRLMPHLLAANLAATGNPDLRWMACNACYYLLARGDIRTAHGLASDLREHWRERLGEDHEQTQMATIYLAWALRDMGRYAEARDLDQDTLDRYRRILGEDHASTLNSAGNLAADLRALGEMQAARDLDQDTLDRRRRVLGTDHPQTLVSAINLASDLRELGHVQAARDLDQDTLDRRRRVLGADHPDTLQSANNLAADLHMLEEAGDES